MVSAVEADICLNRYGSATAAELQLSIETVTDTRTLLSIAYVNEETAAILDYKQMASYVVPPHISICFQDFIYSF